jgi:hypothetical protein
MDTKEQNKRWHLVRNDNGEWISDENAVIVSKLEVGVLKVWAAKQGKALSVQHGPDGTLWCYKHEVEAIDLKIKESTTINRKLRIRKSMGKEKSKEMYYNRAMSPNLFTKIKKEYQWLIDAVKQNPELDFQTGSNNNDSWFSIYRGTGRILTIKEKGKPYADPKYMKMCPNFYDNPNAASLSVLMERIKEDSGLGRYYIGADGKRKEGYYQNLISRRYSLYCEPNDDFIIIDKEFVLGYSKDEVKKGITHPIIKKYDDIIQSLSDKYDYCKNIKQSGTECDFVGLTRQGDIILLELKRHEDTTKIFLSPLQAGKYDDLTKEYVRRYYDDFNKDVLKMVIQKKNMRILKPKWEIPVKLSGKIIPAVVVGGNPSKAAKERFDIVRKAVGKDIPLYTCNEKGTLLRLL